MSGAAYQAPKGAVIHEAKPAGTTGATGGANGNGNGNGHAVTTSPAPILKPSEEFRRQLERMDGELKMALPSHIKPEKFRRVVQTVVTMTPELLEADRRTLLGACMKCAADGLVPDGREAALVIFNTKVKTKQPNGSVKEEWVKAVQYMPMKQGILKRIRNSGVVTSVQALAVRANDKFSVKRGLTESLEHEADYFSDRGPLVGVYAIAKFNDGSDPIFVVMGRADVEKRRKVSRSKDKDGNPYGPWKDWEEEMYEKTALRRLANSLPMDAEVSDLLRRDDEAPVMIGNASAATLTGPSKLDALAIEHDGDGVILANLGDADDGGDEGDGRMET